MFFGITNPYIHCVRIANPHERGMFFWITNPYIHCVRIANPRERGMFFGIANPYIHCARITNPHERRRTFVAKTDAPRRVPTCGGFDFHLMNGILLADCKICFTDSCFRQPRSSASGFAVFGAFRRTRQGASLHFSLYTFRFSLFFRTFARRIISDLSQT